MIDRILFKQLTLKRITKSVRSRLVNFFHFLRWRLVLGENEFSFVRSADKAILLANGPSLRELDIENIAEDWDIYGMNRVYLENDILRRLNGLFLANKLVASQFREDFLRLDCPLIVPSSLLGKLEWKDHISFLKFNPMKGGFAKDLTSSFNPASTVTYFALQCLYVLGYKKVIILGLDHNFGTQNSVNFTELMLDDKYHFRSDYFPKGILWETPDLYGSEYWYRIAKESFELDGRELFDATLGGKCEIFDKIDYGDFMQGKFD